MAYFFQKNKREFGRKLVVVFVEYFNKRDMSRKQATNKEIERQLRGRNVS